MLQPSKKKSLLTYLLAIHHGLEVVDNHPAFYDRHGNLIMRFYNQTDSIHPSCRLLCQMNNRNDKWGD